MLRTHHSGGAVRDSKFTLFVAGQQLEFESFESAILSLAASGIIRRDAERDEFDLTTRPDESRNVITIR